MGKPQDLDVSDECDRLFFWLGAVAAEVERDADAQTGLWKLLPFVKALCRVGKSHQNELMFAWKEALQEPMPFGCAPVGLPKEGD